MLLPYALWDNITMHSSVTGYMSSDFKYGQKSVMLVERTISSWLAVDWTEEMS